MANKTLTDLYGDNPVTTLTDNDLFEVEQASGPTSGAIKVSDFLKIPFGFIFGSSFTTNNATVGSTGTITLSQFIAGDFSTGWADLPINTRIVFTEFRGTNQVFNLTAAPTNSGGDIVLTVSPVAAGAVAWNGTYSVSFIPSKQSATDVGLGNVTNDAQLKVSDLGVFVLATNGDGSGLTALGSAPVSAALVAQDISVGSIAGDGQGLTLNRSQILTALGVTPNLAGLNTFLTIFGVASFTDILALNVISITPVADGPVTPVTSVTTSSGIVTVLS